VSVLIVGSVALDSVTTPYGEAKEILGGSATHASYSASFYSPINLVGVVGNDFPEQYVSLLQERKISLEGLQIADGKTFRWSGYYEYDMNQAYSLSTELNVFSTFRPVIPESYRSTGFVFLANIDPELQLDVLRQMEKPEFVALDTMNYWIQNKKEDLLKVIAKVDMVLLNDAEARQLCNTPNLIKAAKQVLSMGPKIVIIKKGEHGALLITKDFIFSAPAFPLESIYDPTGAGDTFAGGFIGYLASTGDINETNLRRAMITGSCMASFNVEDFSLNRLRRLSQPEIFSRYQEFMNLSHFDPLEGMGE
jgi:sugar/nucleoside kinase (ribokinase family)